MNLWQSTNGDPLLALIMVAVSCWAARILWRRIRGGPDGA